MNPVVNPVNAYLPAVVVGGWQLAAGHSSGALEALEVLEAYYEAGFRTFDCADIYTGVESLLGSFIRAHGLGPDDVRVHTKYVPDLSALEHLSFEQIEAAMDRSRTRLGLEVLDLVQFHWWHLPSGDYLRALHDLHALQRSGKLRAVGLTNFDAPQVRAILAEGIPVAAMQVQYSLLDRRPAAALAPLLAQHGVALLAYGSVAGGLLSGRYLGASEPRAPFENRSLAKYLLVVEEVGGWDALQGLLRALEAVAGARAADLTADLATVASAYALAQPGVRACIVGARNTEHLREHLRLLKGFALTPQELAGLEAARRAYPELPGGVYALERDIGGRHGRVMKYELGKG